MSFQFGAFSLDLKLSLCSLRYALCPALQYTVDLLPSHLLTFHLPHSDFRIQSDLL